MTLTEAIKIIQETPIHVLLGNDLEYGKARQLSIEALKRLKDLRYKGYQPTQLTLLGETED